jgi:uncharacterized protein
MTQPEIDGRFAEGIRLFNRGEFFEAHEVWEQAWKAAEGAERIFYQGIIQAAAALLHIQRGNYVGAISVYLRACQKLDQFPALSMGIELGQFRSEMAQYFAALRTSSDARDGNRQPAAAGPIACKEQPPKIRWAPA